MNDSEIERMDGRLRNWGRWAYAPARSPQRCASAEGRYVPPRPDEAVLLAAAVMPVDVSDAEMIEEAICALRSIAERSLMISWYVQGRNKYEIARRLRFEVEFFEAFRRRTIVRLGEFVASRTGVKLIRRGRPIWAGLAK